MSQNAAFRVQLRLPEVHRINRRMQVLFLLPQSQKNYYKFVNNVEIVISKK